MLIRSTNESALANSIRAVALTAHKYVLRYKNSLQRVSSEGSHISMDGVALCRGRSVVRRRTELLPSFCPKATSFNILARSFCSFPVLLPSLSLPTLLTILFPSTQYLKPATRWNFNTISFGSRWQTHLSLSLSFPYSLSFRATSPSQSLLYCLLKTIYNLNPPWSIGGKLFFVPS